jgi:hypothetical protein
VTSIVNNDCAGSACKRQVNVNNGCNCVTLFNPPGGLNEGTSTGLACICAHSGEFTVTQPCNGFQFTVGEGAESTWKEIDYALLLDMRTYKRSSFDTRTFLLVRDSGEKYSNWSAIYESILMRSRYSSFVQAGATILKPTVSTAALRTQSNKEVLRHLPNQYFTT